MRHGTRPDAPSTGRRGKVLAAAGAVALLLVLAVASFALPVPAWRTGRLPVVPLETDGAGAAPSAPRRVWVDTDAACGQGRTTDPDDCLALVLLSRAPEVDLVGISTVFGNAPLEVTDATARALAAMLEAERARLPPIHRGAAAPGTGAGPAAAALRRALADGPLTLLALGPLTNVADALAGRPDLAENASRIVAVMGRRPGHLFHPAEGAEGGFLFGHGPVFRDFNADLDRHAVARVLDLDVPLTLVPYDAARHVGVTGEDLAAMAAAGGAAAWAAERARGWLDFWNEEVGRTGFYPFDLVAAAALVAPGLIDCAEAAAWLGVDEHLWSLPFARPQALLVDRLEAVPPGASAVPVRYCHRPRSHAHDLILERLTGADAG